jgi:hypothetical protein
MHARVIIKTVEFEIKTFFNCQMDRDCFPDPYSTKTFELKLWALGTGWDHW